MTRIFLAAGVAALAISVPAAAGPHDGGKGGGKGDRGSAQVSRGGGGGQRAQAQSVRRGGDRQVRAQVFNGGRRDSNRGARLQAFGGGGGGHFVQARPQRQERVQRQRSSQQRQVRQLRQNVDRGHARMVARQQARGHGQVQNRMAVREQRQLNRRQAVNRQQIRAERQAQRIRLNGANQNRFADGRQLRFNPKAERQFARAERQQLRVNQRIAANNLLAQRHALRADNIANVGAWQTSPFASLVNTPRTRFIAPAQAVGFVGEPVRTVTNYVTLSALPASVSYLYPDTRDYYYRYGDGYLYQVDRSSSLIGALIPLLAGGYLPGTYLPQPYMTSYVPDYYGLSSFYPASYDFGYASYGYGGYGYDGYGYDNLCNRYANGVVYQVDCYTGLVQNVIPTYVGGYGVGQMIPSAYSYYNVPMQYRDLYYPTDDYSYWYAPGAIYQYDTDTSLITSVAALMSPGFSIGQPLPAGYGVYNVPYAYRATYYDTPTAWYRYNNGYIYQVDPTTQLVTAIVASLLT